MNKWIEHEQIVKDTIFEFVSLYGPSNNWDTEIVEVFNETVERKIKQSKEQD